MAKQSSLHDGGQQAKKENGHDIGSLFSNFILPGLQLMGWCCPFSGRIFLWKFLHGHTVKGALLIF
jgi:hypothetical protein